MSTEKVKVLIKKLYPDALLPKRAHKTDAGWDLTANLVRKKGLFLYEYKFGIALEIPDGYEGQIRARSSVFTTGLILSNGVGTIDACYRGEISAVFWKIPFFGKPYKKGERCCQIIFKEVPDVVIKEAKKLSDTERGNGGYGSTGK